MSKYQLSADLNNPVQENFLGIGAVYHGYAGFPDDAGRIYNDELAEIEFNRAGEVGVKIARTFYKWYAWEGGDSWNWENERMKLFYRWLDAMKKRGISVALQMGWWCPGDINSTCHNGASPFTVEGDWEKSVQNYAEWVSENVHQLIELRGFTNIKYLMMFTEPQYGSGVMPEGKNTYTAWFDAAKAAHEQLVKDNRRQLVKLMGPNEGSTVTSDMLHWVAENGGEEFIDIFSSHNYQWSPEGKEEDVHSGGRSLTFAMRGARCQQKISLQPNTDYTISAYMKLNHKDILHVSGYMVMGAFVPYDGDLFTSGGQPTSRLHRNSTLMIDAVTMSEDWEQYSYTFHSGDAKECLAGIFFDIVGDKCGVSLDDISVKKVSTGEEILLNGSFESDTHWDFVVNRPSSGDPYLDWMMWLKTGMQYVPKGKGYCFDEYNVMFDNRFEDPKHGTRIALTQTALLNSGAQTSICWTLFDQQWPNNHTTNADAFYDGNHRYGIMPVLLSSLVPYPWYYSFALVSRYTGGEGTRVYSGGGENLVHMSVCELPDGNFTVVLVNCRNEENEMQVSFNKTIGKTLHRHLYDPEKVVPTAEAKLIGADKDIKVENAFIDVLPPYGVAVYTSIED